MPVHEEYMREPNRDNNPCPMPPIGMPDMNRPYPPIGMPETPGMQPPIGMPGMCPPMPMPRPCPPVGMPGMCPPMPMPVMGEQDMKELCYMEHMHESMSHMCQAEACRIRAMQCMHKY